MTATQFRKTYNGTIQGVRYYVEAGASVDLPDEHAEHIENDQPGTIAPPEAPAAETRAIDAPPADRMLRQAPKKRGVR